MLTEIREEHSIIQSLKFSSVSILVHSSFLPKPYICTSTYFNVAVALQLKEAERMN